MHFNFNRTDISTSKPLIFLSIDFEMKSFAFTAAYDCTHEKTIEPLIWEEMQFGANGNKSFFVLWQMSHLINAGKRFSHRNRKKIIDWALEKTTMVSIKWTANYFLPRFWPLFFSRRFLSYNFCNRNRDIFNLYINSQYITDAIFLRQINHRQKGESERNCGWQNMAAATIMLFCVCPQWQKALGEKNVVILGTELRS